MIEIFAREIFAIELRDASGLFIPHDSRVVVEQIKCKV